MNVQKVVVLADSQGKSFCQHLEKQDTLTKINSGDKIKDLYKQRNNKDITTLRCTVRKEIQQHL